MFQKIGQLEYYLCDVCGSVIEDRPVSIDGFDTCPLCLGEWYKRLGTRPEPKPLEPFKMKVLAVYDYSKKEVKE